MTATQTYEMSQIDTLAAGVRRAVAKQAPIDPATGKPQLPPNIKSLGKVNELGTLFCAVAGMMNLIVAIDAAFPRGRRPVSAGP